MKTYIPKSLIKLQAIEFNNDNISEVVAWIKKYYRYSSIAIENNPMQKLSVEYGGNRDRQKIHIRPGSHLVKGITGHLFKIRSRQFHETYIELNKENANREIINLRKYSNILCEVAAEWGRQDEKCGTQNHSPIEWMPILMEEVGEASKEVVDYHFKNPAYDCTVGFIPPNEFHQQDRLSRYRKELIQVAAVAVSMIESLDRNELSQPKQ